MYPNTVPVISPADIHPNMHLFTVQFFLYLKASASNIALMERYPSLMHIAHTCSSAEQTFNALFNSVLWSCP